MFKEGRYIIQDEDRPGRPTKARTPEMVDLVNAFILSDKRVTVENISEQLKISVRTAHKIVHRDLSLSKVSNCWVTLR